FSDSVPLGTGEIVERIDSRIIDGETAPTQLREQGASTVVDQVIDEIAQGKQIVYKSVLPRKQTRELQRTEADEVRTDRGRKREYAETVEYSPQERLELLLEAVDRAVFDAARIDAELVEQYGTIRFVP